MVITYEQINNIRENKQNFLKMKLEFEKQCIEKEKKRKQFNKETSCFNKQEKLDYFKKLIEDKTKEKINELERGEKINIF